MAVIPDGTPVAWLNEDHPQARSGPGFYLVVSNDPNNHHNAQFTEKLIWKKNTPDEEGTNNDTNNEGHWESED